VQEQNPDKNNIPQPKLESQPQGQIDPHKMRMFYQRVKDDQRFLPGVAASIAGAAVGAAAWGAVTALTNIQFGLMALAVGYLAGFGMRKGGQGIDKHFGIAAAVIAFIGCLAGNALTICIKLSEIYEIGLFEVIDNMTLEIMIDALKQTFSVFDLFFYGIAVYYGYISAFRKMTPEEMKQVMT
jgi:hypothetical protein